MHIRYYVTLILFFSLTVAIQAQTPIREICPTVGLQTGGTDFQPSGIILTAFSADSIWVYDIALDTRYPLPQTRPCTSSCHLSADATWMTYLDPETMIFGKMRLDGTSRTPLADNAADVEWWSADTLLVWTVDHRAYLRSETDPLAITPLEARSIRSIQPSGTWALAIDSVDGVFYRYLVNLETLGTVDEQRYRLAPDSPYFNGASWSPNGQILAYVGLGAQDPSIGLAGAEIFFAQPNNAIPQQKTYLSDTYGAVRINGYAPASLSWSPDSTYLAFWVIELLGTDPEANTGNAVMHILNTQTGELARYCSFSTIEHTPNPPRLVWSPDGTTIAFAGNIPEDNKGFLLLALDIETGILTELSDGVYPAGGQADVYVWGNRP